MKILPILRSQFSSAFAYVRSDWRALAIYALIAILAFVLYQDRNRNRFVYVPDSGFVLDTRTGQFCNPWLKGHNRDDLPMCSDILKSWR